MNKLQGFYALEKSNLPSVPWRKYYDSVKFDKNILWTVRSAIKQGNDLNLPRKVGVTSDVAEKFAKELNCKLGPNDLIIYYPYFIAIKSGVLDISKRRIVIEAVKDDLWNLVTNNRKDVTIIFEDDDIRFIGDANFLKQDELIKIIDCCPMIKRQFYSDITDGKSVMLEWSFACKSNLDKQPIGDVDLIFYEIRTV